MVNMRQIVTPPAFTPGQYGLLSAIDLRKEANPHWRNGITWQSICGIADSTYSVCVTGSPETSGVGAPDEKSSNIVRDTRGATAFTVYAAVECSSVGFYEDANSLAIEALTRTENWRVENAFWTGTVDGQEIAFPHLAADAEVVDGEGILLQTAAEIVSGGGVLTASQGLGLLEQELADCYGGGVGFIHVPVRLIPTLTEAYLIYRDGKNLRTYNGNIVVAGAGYPGTSPAGADPGGLTSWMYATGPVFGYQSDIHVNPAVSTLDREVNTVLAIAERTYVLGWDCCHAAVQVSLGT